MGGTLGRGRLGRVSTYHIVASEVSMFKLTSKVQHAYGKEEISAIRKFKPHCISVHKNTLNY